MNQEVKRAWVEALRSGGYKQATGRLRHEDGFCCLGVLTDLFSKDQPDYSWRRVADAGDSWCFTHLDENKNLHGSQTFPCRAVREWAELDSFDPIVTDPVNLSFKLSELNDNGMSFNEIANLIEEQL